MLWLAVITAITVAVAAVLTATAATTTAAAFIARTITGLITEIASHSLLSKNAARSALRRAPTFCPSTWPFLKRMSVGIPRTLKRCGIFGLSSILIFAILTLSLNSPAISSSMGAIILHGPHHSAQKSNNTGSLALSTSSSKLASVTCRIVSLLTRNTPQVLRIDGWVGCGREVKPIRRLSWLEDLAGRIGWDGPC